jgi:hypothetical protein
VAPGFLKSPEILGIIYKYIFLTKEIIVYQSMFSMKKTCLFFVFYISCYLIANAQITLPSEDLHNITSARYIQRTMNLLKSSTPEKRNTVRILVYGQSLSAQDWWLNVKNYFGERFPGANLVMDNKAIGGFASQFLIKTVRRDILDFYPDLIIFHVFGSDHFYEQVLVKMRSLTSTEIVIWNDPQNDPEPNEWHEKMSYQIIPSFAVKYKCMFIDLRTPINKLVNDNNLVYADEFTRDGLHFNEKGCDMMASQIIPYLNYDSKHEEDPDNLLKIYVVGNDVYWNDGVLVLPFEGNKVDVVLPHTLNSKTRCSIFIDGKKPSEFSGAYNHTRPNDNGEKGWIWKVGAPVRIQHKAPWVNELFTLTFDSIDYDSRFFSFQVEGSECGFEGNGNNREDFISNSGRVFIQANEVHDSIPGDSHVFRNFDVNKFQIDKGYQTTWRTYLMGSDIFVPHDETDRTVENSITLFKGISNGKHTLKLVSESPETPDITLIKVYKPLIEDIPSPGY